MKTPVRLLILLLAASAAMGQAPDAFLIQNPAGRTSVSLDGPWRVISDPLETGYYNHRYEPRDDGYFLALEHTDPGELIEYDFRRSQLLNVPGDWNSQDERYFSASTATAAGTAMPRKTARGSGLLSETGERKKAWHVLSDYYRAKTVDPQR
jgi:hypothetical protein